MSTIKAKKRDNESFGNNVARFIDGAFSQRSLRVFDEDQAANIRDAIRQAS